MDKDTRVRADHWVRQAFAGLSRSQIEEAFEKGWVRAAGGGRVAKGDKLENAGGLDLKPLENQLAKVREGNPALEVPVVFENDEIWVVDKPAGVPGHPLKLSDDATLTHWAFRRDAKVKEQFPEIQPTLTPHRLDTGTSGLQIVCKTAAAYEEWRRRFTAKEVTKTYQAWCWGVPEKEKWNIQSSIGKAPGDGSLR
ncbi:hypothetical protein K2X33_00285, partial [bacterium]|nr:hypothetical protein [bacterium]